MTTDSDSECSYVATLADFNVIRLYNSNKIVIRVYNSNNKNKNIIVIRVILIVIRVIIIIIVIQFEKKFTEIESQKHKRLVYDG